MSTLINKNPERRVQYKIDANKTEIMFPNLECVSAALLREILPSGSTPAGDSAYITDASNLVPVESLKVNIQPVQAGSGDPSPENVRAISGWDSVQVTRAGRNLVNTYTIPLGRTVYGGTLDVTTGELVVDRGIVQSSTASDYVRNSATNYYLKVSAIPGVKLVSTSEASVVSDRFMSAFSGGGSTPGICYLNPNGPIRFNVTGDGYDTVANMLAGIGAPTFIYPLENPQTYTLTPQQVTLLKGINNVFADAGTVEVKYSADIQLYIDKKIAETQALILEN